MKTYLPIGALRAALETACRNKKDVREYLRAVLLEFKHSPVARINVVSTDGAIMGAFRVPLEYDSEPQTADFSILVPLDAVQRAIKSADKRAYQLAIESLPDGRYTLGDVVFACMGANRFPTWTRVIPPHDAPASSNPQQFNPDLLVRARDALRAFYGTKEEYQLTHLDNMASAMHAGSNDAVVVIMPLRDTAFSHCNTDRYQGFFNA